MIDQYIIYGERHSGTKFLKSLIEQEFQINYASGFEHKHFFTPKNILNQSRVNIKSTLFLCIVRNPYDWIMAFHKERYHCGINGSNNIYTFMSKPWSSRHPFLGPEIFADRHLYNGLKYNNIFHMRLTKNQFMYCLLPLYVDNHIFVRYEDFLCPNYSNFFIQHIMSVFKIQKRNIYNHPPNKVMFKNKKYYYNTLTEDVFDYINNSVDWSFEYHLGYKKASNLSELRSSVS